MLNKPTGDMLDAGSASNPQPAGTPTPGTSTSFARADHVHAVPIVALVGDVTGNSSGNTVGALLGRTLSSQAPSSGQALLWSGTAWTPGTVSGGGGGSGGGQIYYLSQGTTSSNPPSAFPDTKVLSRTNAIGQTLLDFPLINGSYTVAARFITNLNDPNTALIPSGLWDISIFAYSNADTNHPTSVRATVYKYSGTTLSLIGTSQVELMSNGAPYAEKTFTVSFQDTVLLTTDRIYIALEASASANGHHLYVAFGDGTPSHAHTTIPDVAVSGTGLYKLLNGVPQSPATLLVDSDVSSSAAIAVSKIAGAVTTSQLAGYVATSQLGALGGVATLDSAGKLTTAQIPALTTAQIAQITPAVIGAVATGDVISISHGGTGATSRQAALNALSGSQAASQFLRGDGTNVSMSAIQASDLPTIAVNKGGTGQTSFADGELLIGNSTGNTLTKASLTAGSNITITPGHGSITISSSSATGTVTTSAPVTTGALSKFASASAITDAVAGTDYVLPSGSITGTAGNITGVLAITNGGTGATSASDAIVFLGAVAAADLVTTKTPDKVPKLTGDGLLSVLQIPAATAQDLGGIVVGSGLAVDSFGVLSVAGAGVPGIVVTQLTGDGNQTSFPISGYTSADANAYSVAVEGIDQRPATDYAIESTAGGTIVFATAPALDAPIVVRAYIVGSGGGGGGSGNATQLQGRDISTTAPGGGQALLWNDQVNQWIPQQCSNADATSLRGYPIDSSTPQEGYFLRIVNGAWTATSVTLGDAQSLQGIGLNQNNLSPGYVLTYDGSQWGPQATQGVPGPEGPQGPQGAEGRSLYFKGAWTGTACFPYDVVTYQGTSWIAITYSDGSYPPVIGSDWQIIAERGDNGTNGQGFNWRGTFDYGTRYEPYDIVFWDDYMGRTGAYICIVASLANEPTNTIYWNRFA